MATADQHPDARHRVDGALGDWPQAPSFLVPSASHQRVDAVGCADQPQEQDSRCQHQGSLALKSRPTGIGPHGLNSEIKEAECSVCPATETPHTHSETRASARL